LTARPVAETLVRLTLPAKLNVLFSDKRIETPVCPTFRSTLVARILKSPTWMVTRVTCDTVPGDGDPVMVTL
jgi:hypothetical protein